jgi:PIN domain nuclease of toxin-antitoxin system
MILLDTHVLVWMVSDSSRLSRPAARELRKAEQNAELAIASITLWELALLYSHGRLRTTGTMNPLFGQSLKSHVCKSLS